MNRYTPTNAIVNNILSSRLSQVENDINGIKLALQEFYHVFESYKTDQLLKEEKSCITSNVSNDGLVKHVERIKNDLKTEWKRDQILMETTILEKAEQIAARIAIAKSSAFPGNSHQVQFDAPSLSPSPLEATTNSSARKVRETSRRRQFTSKKTPDNLQLDLDNTPDTNIVEQQPLQPI